MGRATHILIVDDDADFRAALRQVLEKEGCTVQEAADGKMALGVLRVLPSSSAMSGPGACTSWVIRGRRSRSIAQALRDEDRRERCNVCLDRQVYAPRRRPNG